MFINKCYHYIVMKISNILATGLVALAGFCMPSKVSADNKISRNDVSFSLNYSNVNVNGKGYESGSTTQVQSSLEFKPAEWIYLVPKLDIKYATYGLLEENASEDIAENRLSLDGFVKLKRNFYVGIGAEAYMHDERMMYEGVKGRVKRSELGPKLSLAFRSDMLDATLSMSHKFGRKNTTYDSQKSFTEQNVSLDAEFRKGIFDIRGEARSYNWTLANIPSDYNSMGLDFLIQPGIEVSERFILFPNFAYSWDISGNDSGSAYEIGAGARFRW